MQISTISPSTFDSGKSVTLTGSGFGSSTGQVLIGGVAQNVNTWSDTGITFTTVRGSQSLGACRVDVVGGVGSNSVTVTGTDFGVAPNVILYRSLDGTEGNTVDASAPAGEIGAFSTSTMIHVSDGAAGFASAEKKILRFVHGSSFRRFRFSQTVKVPDTYYPPGDGPTVIPSDETWGSDSAWKIAWFMLGANGYQNSDPDLCIPTMIGSGAMAVSGNTTQPGVRYWDYPASASKPADHWDWDEWNTFQIVMDCDETNPRTTSVSQAAYFTSAQTGGTKTTGTKTYSWSFPGQVNAPSNENAYFDRVDFNTYAVSHPTQPEKTMTHYRDLYLAVESSVGAGDYRQACFLGNASTLATCTRIRMKVASTWSSTSVMMPVSDAERLIYTHAFVQRADGSTVSVAL